MACHGSALAASLLTVALLLGGTVGCVTRPDPEGTSLVLVTVDTFRYDLLVYGSEVETPNLDRLRAAGAWFEQAIAPMPRTTPAVGSLLTGLWPHDHGSREVGEPIDRLPTMATLLRERGWWTGAVSANLSASSKQRLDRGFDHFVEAQDLISRHGDRLYRNLEVVGRSEAIGWAEATTASALELTRSLDPGSPFFLWVFYFDPHFIYLPPPPHDRRTEAEECWRVYRRFAAESEHAGQLFWNVGGVAESALAACRSLYHAEIEYFDAELGRLLDRLEQRGLLARTFVVFTADHGENLGEDGLFFEHGPSVHDAALRVPLSISGPGVVAGRVDRTSVSLVDVAPTLLTLLGIPADERPPFEGRDLSPRLGEGAALPPDLDRPVFAESAASVWHQTSALLVTGWEGRRTCINGARLTLCRQPRRGNDRLELFDHTADPGLLVDLLAVSPPAPTLKSEAKTLEIALERWSPASARQRVARTARFKLVQSPRLEGGYDDRLFDLTRDLEESTDVKDRFPEVYRELAAALGSWLAERSSRAPGERHLDIERRREIERDLRALGYLDE